MRARAAANRDFRLSRSPPTIASFLLEQGIGALELVVPQHEALDAIGKLLQRGHVRCGYRQRQRL